MMEVQRLLWSGSAILQALLCVRLILLGRGYSWFCAYLALAVVSSGVLFLLPVRSDAYTQAWITVEIPLLAVLYLAAREVFVRLAQHFPTLTRGAEMTRYARRVMNVILVGAVLFSLLLASLDGRALIGKSGLAVALALAFLAKRVVTGVLACYLILAAWYFSRFQAELQPNLRRHGLLFTIWSSLLAVATFWRNLAGERYATLGNNLLLLATCICYGLWIVLLTPKGEQAPSRPSVLPEEALRTKREMREVTRWFESAATRLRRSP
jgi:uncharacterized membrane protein YfbV (UPF0208 family)